jgi:AcrR family transcriptional regulator
MASSVKHPTKSGGLLGYGEREGVEARLPAPPTQARGAEKRDRIYEVALARYEADGVAATRVEDVIVEAGVSWATFFRYFPRKGDVLLELAARHFRGPVRAAAAEGLGNGRMSARTVVERTFAALLEPADTSPELHSAALLEVFAQPARFAAMLDQGEPQPMVGLVAELLAEAQRRDELRPEFDPGAAALTVVAGALFPAVQAAALGADPSGPLAVALDILWGGLQPAGS